MDLVRTAALPLEAASRLISGKLSPVDPLPPLEASSLANMSRRLNFIIVLGLALAGCESEPDFDLATATMDCSETSCLVTFVVSNRTEDRLPMIYEISLSQNYAHDPNKSGLVDVGSANGTFELLPEESKKIEVDVEVSEIPNGSMVSVADSRTPDSILEILGF